jgi:WD40 repeat protein
MNQHPLSPNRTVVTSFAAALSASSSSSYDEGHYVLHVINTKGSASKRLLSCASSDRSILTYDQETLKKVHSIEKVHNETITDVCFSQIVGNNSPELPMIVSSGLDGTVKIFDLRSSGNGKTALEMKIPDQEALSVSIGYNGALAAVGGSKGNIHFFDLRNVSSGNSTISNPLGTYVDSHTEEVTKVRFQDVAGSKGYETTSLLVSAGEDGLACIFDTSQPSEEAALRSVLNIQSPLRDVNFFGPSLEGIYCLTGSETMSVWHHDSAQRMSDYGDVRNMLSVNAGIVINYLVGCHWDGSELNLVAGNTNGDCALFQVEANAISAKSILKGGHKSCIRAFVSSPIDKTLITGGEDARLCEWNLVDKNLAMEETNKASFSMTKENAMPKQGGGRLRRPKSKKSHAPY